MNTKPLEKFAQNTRRQLQEQVNAKLTRVLRTDSADLRARAEAIAELKHEIEASSREVVVERVAYTWFNRFCALRYMDVNRYTRMGVVSPATSAAGEAYTQPEILQEAKQGYIDPDLPVDRETVLGLLNGRLPSPDPQQEAYRLLLVGACNGYHRVMPFMFERIEDYTELLMPDDLLSAGSILQATREALTPEACQDVEVIGWLYQFYISEKKDAVLASKKKIAPEDIPAVTQLFTPHWIVRYLAENSLGRLWMLNRPHSRLAEQMPYYIKPEQEESDYLRVGSPEELRVCDPAVGSGHMLTYAFDLLYAMYEEEGYNPPDIPRLILENNLYGMEIDERAGALAAFALTMKARERDRRFFRRDVRPNIIVLQPIEFNEAEIHSEVDEMVAVLSQKTKARKEDKAHLRADVLHDLNLFVEADNFGSLLRPLLSVEQIAAFRSRMKTEKDPSQGDWVVVERRERLGQALRQAEYLARNYHLVIANPPYMGSSNANARLKSFLNSDYKDVKSDLFSAFIVRNTELTLPKGQLGFMTPFVWMFISSYEKIRNFLIDRKTITSLIQLEYSGFAGATVPICTFTLENAHHPDFKGGYVRLSDFRGADNQAPKTLEAIGNPDCGWFYRASAADFKKIPGAPIAYWAIGAFFTLFDVSKKVGNRAVKGLDTGGNIELFLRRWFEVKNVDLSYSSSPMHKWFPIAKGGSFRRWYGNHDFIINYENDGRDLHKNKANLRNKDKYFRSGLTWTVVSSSGFAVRYMPEGFLFDQGGSGIFSAENDSLTIEMILGSLNSIITKDIAKILCPTLNFTTGDVRKFLVWKNEKVHSSTILCIRISKSDWDAYETSWDFTTLPFLRPEFRQSTLAATYVALCAHWQDMTDEMQQLEEESNRIIIEAYGLQEELTLDLPLEEITLTCNPCYRYSGNKSEEELEKLLLADTMREFISYAVGCMFGRYSLDKPGLILANQGETLEDYLRQVPYPTFLPDKDNAIPMLDGNWFEDDIVDRFKKFLRITFGEEHYEENLAFIENTLGRDIRNYFLREFYGHHVKTYKKRPIYWLFSSPKGNFNALIYMHRYRPDTVSVVLNDYLREFRAKLTARKAQLEAVSISASAPQREKTAALRDIDKLDKVLKELREYEDEVLFPLATRRLEIDLDDGVKVNYNKFGSALKKVAGLSK